MPKNPAITADTSSAPAASTAVVEPAAAAFAAPTDDPIPARSDAAAATHSGLTITTDILVPSDQPCALARHDCRDKPQVNDVAQVEIVRFGSGPRIRLTQTPEL
ncbi:hypothetical protein MMRN_25940 [Mycobacterium marinum]|nr:hypothetical protein MMEU_0699 [Mycobacterium marinum str. Europe]BBC65698.1 hypothetical protein MMRN_25940 [Mycobacterium marinum]